MPNVIDLTCVYFWSLIDNNTPIHKYMFCISESDEKKPDIIDATKKGTIT